MSDRDYRAAFRVLLSPRLYQDLIRTQKNKKGKNRETESLIRSLLTVLLS